VSKDKSAGRHPIVIIGPINCVKLDRRGRRVVWFVSTDAYERWRATKHRGVSESIRSSVLSLVNEVARGAVPDDMRTLLAWLADRPSAPTACELASTWSSRRSFFRAWASTFTCSPAKFLSRVRAMHARALLLRGVSVHEAAKRSGVHSANELYRLLRRWH